VTGYLAFSATSLTTVDLPALASVGALDFTPSLTCSFGNLNLTTLDLPNLKKVGPSNGGPVYFGFCPVLPLCRIQALLAQFTQAGWIGTPTLQCTYASAPCP
jgi:hypothetical protein